VPGACRVEIIMEEQAAVDRAFDEASEGDLLVLLIDDVDGAIERLKGRRFSQPAASDPTGVAP
jgi:cyanophycin synthetase